jgi:glucose/arabinose dehydrogenase
MCSTIRWIAMALAMFTGLAGAQPLDLESVHDNLDGAIFVTHAGDGSNRLFIVEQEGLIRVSKDGVLLPTPFLDITDPVICCSERGLLGLAFAPDYETSGEFYVNYTTTALGPLQTRISRFTTSPVNADSANSGTEEILLTYNQPANNHNGGWIGFGPDGYLYIASGDGGGGGDTWSASGNAQDRNTLLGKILRIDVSGDVYTIPTTNPFVRVANTRSEIWAYGLRNPWRNSFDRVTGDLYIGDVGQGDAEEVSFLVAGSAGGQNFGWRAMEGNLCFDETPQGGNPPCNDPSFTDPIHTYDHGSGRCSITGGYVYRGDKMPGSRGTYFFADYCGRQVYSFRNLNGTGVAQFAERTSELNTGASIPSFGEDEQGELYIVTFGELFRIVDPAAEELRTEVVPDFRTAAGVDNKATLAELQGAGVTITPETFDLLDKNGDDAVSLSELLNATGVGEIHHGDANLDGAINLNELLRMIQLYNASRYSCSSSETEDGFQVGPGDLTCTRHSADYQLPQGSLSLSEILRVIQFYNTGGMAWCPDSGSEDGYCPVTAG